MPHTCLFVVNVSRSWCFSTIWLVVYLASHLTSERARMTSLQSWLEIGWNTEFAGRTSNVMKTDTAGKYWNGISFFAGSVCIICFCTLNFCLPVALFTFVCRFFSSRMNLAICHSTCCSAHFNGFTMSLCLSLLSSKNCLMWHAASVIPCLVSIWAQSKMNITATLPFLMYTVFPSDKKHLLLSILMACLWLDNVVLTRCRWLINSACTVCGSCVLFVASILLTNCDALSSSWCLTTGGGVIVNDRVAKLHNFCLNGFSNFAHEFFWVIFSGEFSTVYLPNIFFTNSVFRICRAGESPFLVIWYHVILLAIVFARNQVCDQSSYPPC